MPTETSYNYLLDNKERWLAENPGFFVVIKDGKLCGMYDSEINTEANAPKYGNDLLIIHLDPKGIKEYKLVGLKQYRSDHKL
jgi:hypothetical protein